MMPSFKLLPSMGALWVGTQLYRMMVEKLNFLGQIQPNISFHKSNQIFQSTSDHRLGAIKHLFRYIKSMVKLEISS
jgi:hypothetical protein